jgi:hypothetical protein
MPTNTYVALRTTTLSSDTATITFDLTGISGYTDLVIVANQYVKFSSAGTAGVFLRFNGSSAAYYSTTVLYGNGSSALSARNTNQTRGQVAQTYTSTATTSTKFNPAIINIQNYSNTTTYKTTIGRGNAADGVVDANVMLWRGSTGSSTEAITSIEISTDGTTFYAGSTFSLYGISAIGGVTPKATGGTVTSDSTYWYHSFEMSGNFVPNQSLSCDYLVVAGGGGGGSWSGGGGGAGGFRTGSAFSVTAQSYPITVGGGGSGSPDRNSNGTNGTNSIFSTITSSGGGYGGSDSVKGGVSGGSGGGGAPNSGAGGSGNTPSTSPSQGNNGGTAGSGAPFPAGGGGGAGAVGSNGSGSQAGNGGAGTSSSISGTAITYAGGGGGSLDSGTPSGFGTGGVGGGGNGGGTTSGFPGTVNTGGGGGGGCGGGATTAGGNGGSGIVIIRYLKA